MSDDKKKLQVPVEVEFKAKPEEQILQPGQPGFDAEGFGAPIPPPAPEALKPFSPHKSPFPGLKATQLPEGAGREGMDLTPEEKKELVCHSCKHFWEIKKFAATQNRLPEGVDPKTGLLSWAYSSGPGKPLEETERYCLVVPRRPMDLSLRLVRECNRHKLRKD